MKSFREFLLEGSKKGLAKFELDEIIRRLFDQGYSIKSIIDMRFQDMTPAEVKASLKRTNDPDWTPTSKKLRLGRPFHEEHLNHG